jgi:pantoate--beta-alanine ligase
MLEEEGVDLLFHPSVEEIYPPGVTTFVEVEGLSDRLDGKSRPGHFRGVATVVAKLFHIVQPDVAYFGLKDAAQCAVIRRMVRDLHFDLRLAFCPTVREPDGLAMSSRNAYLSSEERKRALVLYRSLQRVSDLAQNGTADAATLVEAAKAEFASEPDVKLDYLEIVDPVTLEAKTNVHGEVLVAVAAYIGTTRLIDNILLNH